MNITKNVGIYFPWSTGIGTLGIKLGRAYADIFWMNWSLLSDDSGEMTIRSVVSGWRYLFPSGIYFRLPWVTIRGKLIGGSNGRIYFRRFWRIRWVR